MNQTVETNNRPALQLIPHDVVATAAYYHWLEAGQLCGRDQEFWIKAEGQLRKAITTQEITKGQCPRTNQPSQRHEPAIAPAPFSPKVNGRKSRRRPVGSL